MRSFITTAVCLTLVSSTVARVAEPHSYRDLIERDVAETERMQVHNKVQKEENSLVKWFKGFFAQRDTNSTAIATAPAPADTICYEDGYYEFVGSLGPSFCREYLNNPNQTVTEDYTPTSTYVDTYTTQIHTVTSLTRVTPSTTTTVTETVQPPQTKRDAAPLITARAISHQRLDNVFAEYNRRYRRQDASNASTAADSSASMRSAFSSACSCQDYGVATTTVTYTDEPTVATLSAFEQTTTTIQTTRVAGAEVSTETTTVVGTDATSSPAGASTPSSASQFTEDLTASSTASPASPGGPSTATTSSAPTPTAEALSCPASNNQTVSEMVDNERFDYVILCDTVLMDPDLGGASFTYGTFQECVAACSTADYQFNSPVCQGVSFYPGANGTAGNCFLKSSAAQFVSAPGVSTAWLKDIAIGLSGNSSGTTTTESEPFAGQTSTPDPAAVASAVSSMFVNSSSSMPIITPYPSVAKSGMLVEPPITAYSTYMSDGSTYSSGTGYTFATTYANGSYYSYYYTTYTEAWAQTTAVYGQYAGGSAIQNETTTSSSQDKDQNGDTLETIYSNTTSFFPGGYNVTAATTSETFAPNGTEIGSTAVTTIYSYSTGASNSSAGTPASVSATTSTSAYSTEIISSGGTGGAYSIVISGGPSATGGTTVYSTASTVINSFGTAYSSGYFISGQISSTGTGGAASGSGAGGPEVTSTSLVTVIVNSSGANGGGSGGAGGGGPLSTSPTASLISSTIISGGTQGGSSGFTQGGPSSTSSGTFADTGAPRSPFPGSSSTVPTQASSGVYTFPTSPLSVTVSSGATQGGSSGFGSGGPVPSSTGTFTDSGAPRSPYPGSSGLPGTASSGLPGTASSAPFTNSGGPRSPYPSSSSGLPGTSPSGTASSIPFLTDTSGVYVPPTGTFTNSGGPRSPYPLPSSSTPSNETTVSPSGTAPAGTSPGTFTDSGGPRSPYPLPSSGNVTAPLHTGTAPTGTFTNSGGPRSPYPLPSSGNVTAPLPTGTAPTGTFTNSGGPRSPYPLPSSGNVTVPLPTGTAPTGTFTNTGGPRSPYPVSSSGTAPLPPLGTGPTPLVNSVYPFYPYPPFPTAPYPTAPIATPSTCANGTMATTTMFVTTTIMGCASTCMPQWPSYGPPGGYGQGPQAFGPPWATGT